MIDIVQFVSLKPGQIIAGAGMNHWKVLANRLNRGALPLRPKIEVELKPPQGDAVRVCFFKDVICRADNLEKIADLNGEGVRILQPVNN